MSIQPQLRIRLTAAAIGLLGLGVATGAWQWEASLDREAVAEAMALPDLCSRWPALQALAAENPDAVRALDAELEAAGAGALKADARGRLVRQVEAFGQECPGPQSLVDAGATFGVLGSGCVEQGFRSRRCADALSAVFEREPALRPALGTMLIDHPEAWFAGRFAEVLLGGLTGREPERTVGLVPRQQDAGAAALETYLGAARLRVIAAAWVERAFAEAVSEWARGGKGAWHDALAYALGAGHSPGAYLPHVQDAAGVGVGQLVRAEHDRCELVDRPGAATARVVARPCAQLRVRPPGLLGLPAGDPAEGHLLFKAGEARFHAGASAPWKARAPAFFTYSAEAALQPAVVTPGSYGPSTVRLGAPVALASDAPSLMPPVARLLPRWRIRTLTGLAEALPLGAGEGMDPAVTTAVEEWSSPFLEHRLTVAWLSPHGLAVAPAGSERWLVVGGVDYQTVLPEGEECEGAAPYERQLVSVRARAVVPGPQGYFLLFGTFNEERGDCQGALSRRGYFAVVCRAEGCAREDLQVSPPPES